ncbi:unnamed protein product [Arabis nemorensis]|uniref:Senescence-associated carboxylesterase 101 n=1 Tax=Arabis nemorensis TaxID=586526 RepID=A0A565CLJ7_9BRAS|nr:unnamed protein product [Arabis nemorensis]
MDSSSKLKGIELGKLVLSSGLLHSSWSKISEIHNLTYENQDSALKFEIDEKEKLIIVVFAAPPISRNGSASSTLLPKSQDQNPFPFLYSENIDEFSVHTRAFELFSSAQKDLSELKSKLLESRKLVIITGSALGGSVASLFTLSLLETIDPKVKRPLCITFGSPLIGDASLQQILENSVRNSCFLHVADAAMTPITEGFKPFGTFLICDGSGCVCIEDPEAVTELLNGVHSDLVGYSEVRHRLDPWVLSMEDSILNFPDDVIVRMKERARKKEMRLDPFKKLNDMKISLMYLEWYKKKSKEAKMGYYDRFKTQTEVDIKIGTLKAELNVYWKWLVKEVEKKPQSDVKILSRRFLFAGNNYRRMVEPLDIAEYYRNGRKEYQSSANGRSSHYAMLEKWFEKDWENQEKPTRDEKRDLSHLLTFDSCFWAKVEEAMIVIDQVKAVEGMRDGVLTGELVRFEEYVWGLIGERAVSPEIFLEKSSFMRWWKEYKVHSSPSAFTEFMNYKTYKSYGNIIAA